MLVDELPNGRLLEADSIVELRFAPERLTGEIADFIDELLEPRRRTAARPGARRRTGWLTCPADVEPPGGKAAPPRGARRPREAEAGAAQRARERLQLVGGGCS